MIHRALFGSVERFFAILLEHYAGALPTWLSPEQVRVLGVRDDHEDYAHKVADRLRAVGVRVSVGPADEPLGARIRQGQAPEDPLHPGGGGRRRHRRHRRGQPAGERPPRSRRGADRRSPRCWRPRSPSVGSPKRRREPRPPLGRLAERVRHLGRDGGATGDAPAPDGEGPDRCVFCRIAASGPPSADNGVLWVGADHLRRAQRLPLRQRPPDGPTHPPRRWPGGADRRRGGRAVGRPPTRRGGPRVGLRSRGDQPGRQPGAGGRCRASPGTSTCTPCPGGWGTPTS